MPLTPANPRYKTSRADAQTKVQQISAAPSCTVGLDVSTPLTDQDPRSAVILDNFFIRRHGNELRPGSLRWTTNIPDTVLSLMSYNPPRGAGSAFLPILFAAAEDTNIYDVTSQSPEAFVPPVSVAMPGQIQPGVLSWTNFATAGTNYLVVCAAGGGVFTYDDVGGWVNVTALITTVVPGLSINFDFVMAWKNRLWFILNNTTKAFYLPTNSITGAAAEFDFGPLFIHGGDLRAMASWTVDGGDGIDDKLVLMAEGGDVLIYQGTDPAAAATFAIVGRWFLGRPPSGRRFMSKYGGDLALITEYGVEYMSRVLQARSELDPEAPRLDPARRFNEVIGQDVRASQGNFWQLIWLPSEQSVIVTTPHIDPISGYQYCFSAMSPGWSRMVGMPMACAEEFEGALYFGTTEGTVLKAFYGTSDNELSDGTPGLPVVGALQTAFIAPNQDKVNLKRPVLVNLLFTGPQKPSLVVRINTEWTKQAVLGVPAFIDVVQSLWDVGLWDEALWSEEGYTWITWIGVEGLGVYASLRFNIQGGPRTIFTAWKLVYEPGGIM